METIRNGVMFNAYPDSLGGSLSQVTDLLGTTEFRDLFSYFYILPSLFESDLDRGFSVKSYDLNRELCEPEDIDRLRELGIALKLDFVLNHLSVQSPEFRDLLEKGDESAFADFFIDWNRFWEGSGTADEEGCLIPDAGYLEKLFMRKPGLPVLRLPFPDGSIRYYWNTFYQSVRETPEGTEYLGQMDLNAASPLVWDFYRETLDKLQGYGTRIIRLDAFAYLHKEKGESNFFNEPGTWDMLQQLETMASARGLTLLPEIHSTYREQIHKKLSEAGYMFYDFFSPGLIIYSLEEQDGTKLCEWIQEILREGFRTVNMLGCHDGIPLLDLQGLIDHARIDRLIETIQGRGGRVKNLFGPDGKKISYYQVNATYYSALGEDDQKMLLARAIQLFLPGIPLVWYLDLFGGKNNLEKADLEGHKEINRTDLSTEEVQSRLDYPVVRKQMDLIRFRNTHKAFEQAAVCRAETSEDGRHLSIVWENDDATAQLDADLREQTYQIRIKEGNGDLRILEI